MSDGVEQVKPSGEPEPNLSKDAMASVVVFLVALPLCMGIAIASGAPPALGLFTGIIGGFVVGFLGGSPMMVSGPAAGLTVLVYDVVHKHGLEALGPVVLLAGLIQLIAGFAKAGQWFRAVSPAVIYGMLAGIGVLIFGSQFHVMVDDSPRGKGWENLFSIPEAIYKGIFPLDGSQHHLAAAIGIVTIVTLVLWNNFKPKKLSVLPAPLIAVIVGSTATALLGYDIKFVSIPDDLFGEIVWPNLDGQIPPL